MRSNFIWSSAIALAVAMSSVSYAEIVELDLNFRDSGNSIGDEIERLVNLLPGDIDGFDPLSPIAFPLAMDGDVLTDAEIMGGTVPTVTTLSLLGISSNDTGATSVNSGISGFAINSAPGTTGGDASTALDSGLEEQFTISFDSDIEINCCDFNVAVKRNGELLFKHRIKSSRRVTTTKPRSRIDRKTGNPSINHSRTGIVAGYSYK